MSFSLCYEMPGLSVHALWQVMQPYQHADIDERRDDDADNDQDGQSTQEPMPPDGVGP